MRYEIMCAAAGQPLWITTVTFTYLLSQRSLAQLEGLGGSFCQAMTTMVVFLES